MLTIVNYSDCQPYHNSILVFNNASKNCLTITNCPTVRNVQSTMYNDELAVTVNTIGVWTLKSMKLI